MSTHRLYTKAEFDSALSDFNARLTTFEAGINSKIDSQVSSYLDRNGIWNGKKQVMTEDQNRGVMVNIYASKTATTISYGYNVGDTLNAAQKYSGNRFKLRQIQKTDYPDSLPVSMWIPNVKSVITSVNKSGLLCCFYNQAWAAVGGNWASHMCGSNRFWYLMYTKTGVSDTYNSFTPTFGSNYFTLYNVDAMQENEYTFGTRARRWCISDVKIEAKSLGASTWVTKFIDSKTIWETPIYTYNWIIASGYSWHPDVRFINFFVNKGDEIRLSMDVSSNYIYGSSFPYYESGTDNTNCYGFSVAAKINDPQVY